MITPPRQPPTLHRGVVSKKTFSALDDYMWELTYKRIMLCRSARGWVKLGVRRPPTSCPLGTCESVYKSDAGTRPGRYPGLLLRARV